MDHCSPWQGDLVSGQHCNRTPSGFGPERDFQSVRPASYYSQPAGSGPYGYLDLTRRHSLPQTCYNCGSPGHWAQSCPEPRRTVPAGAEIQPPPPKRLKSTALASSRYSNQQHFKRPGLNRRHSQPPVFQTNSLAFNPYPPTPSSAQSPVSPWQQSPQYHSPVQQYPPHYGPYGLPTPSTANSSQFPSPVSSHASHPSPGYFPPQHSPFYNTEQASQSYFEYAHPPAREEWLKPVRFQRSQRDDVPFIPPPTEPWMVELQSLDGHKPQRPSVEQIAWRPPSCVARPLPSTFFTNDEVAPLPSIASLQPGMSVSKYVSDEGRKEQELSIQRTPEWPRRMSDPMFREISSDCTCISTEELIRRRDRVLKQHVFDSSNILEDYHPRKLQDTHIPDSQGAQKLNKQHVEAYQTRNQPFHVNQTITPGQQHRKRSWNNESHSASHVLYPQPKADDGAFRSPETHGAKRAKLAQPRKDGHVQPQSNKTSRKRALSHESMDGESSAPRRQKLEIPTKARNSQLQVASAYSRRW